MNTEILNAFNNGAKKNEQPTPYQQIKAQMQRPIRPIFTTKPQHIANIKYI
jgi:hypothetical protein